MNEQLQTPAQMLLKNPASAIVWQVSKLTNGSLSLAFSTDEYLQDDAIKTLRQFKKGELVNIPRGTATVRHARFAIFKYRHRIFNHVIYDLIATDTGTRFDFSEFELLDYDNPRRWEDNAFYNSYVINNFYDNWHSVTSQKVYLNNDTQQESEE